MKYAETIQDIPNAFEPFPLSKDQREFYYDGTMYARTGDLYDSPIKHLYRACKRPSEHNVFLLLGHRGCGKSTELNEMTERLRAEGYQVEPVSCGEDLDLLNPETDDLLILMGEALVKIAGETLKKLNRKEAEKVTDFWNPVEKVREILDVTESEVETGTKMELPKLIQSVLNIFISAKVSVKFNDANRTTYRERVKNHAGEWIAAMNQIADEVTKKLDGRQPILIFEDLDKLDPEAAWKVFYNRASVLSGVKFPVIYTFPIALYYDPRFRALDGSFHTETFPMIKLEDINGNEYQPGYDTICKIIEKRARLDLFDPEALDSMIRKTGGALRDLFTVIIAAARRADDRDSGVIAKEDAERALIKLQSSLTRTIDGEEQYKFLAGIFRDHKKIPNRAMLLDMLQARTVLEYNGQRWHNIHPLVADYLEELGYLP